MKYIRNNFESIIFGLFLDAGFALLMLILTISPFQHFVFGSIILYLLLLMEIVAIRGFARRKMIQLNMSIINDREAPIQNILHYVLPSIIYWLVVVFIVFEPNTSIWLVILAFISLIFINLFVNIRAYYEDKFKLEMNTHHIYDFLKLMILGIGAFDIISAYYIFDFSGWFVFLGIFILCAGILILNQMRYGWRQGKKSIFWVLGISLILAIVAMLVSVGARFDSLKATLVLFVCIYISVGLLHHYATKDLSREIVLEYLMVGILVIAAAGWI